MKKLLVGALALLAAGTAVGSALAKTNAPAAMLKNIEAVDITVGAPALMRGDNRQALQQILAAGADASDPAVLINLGRVYSRMGQTSEAAKAFRAAMNNRNHFDVLLSDGRIMDSRQVARLSLQYIQPNASSRVAGR